MIQRESYRVGMPDVDAFGIVYFAAYWRWYQMTVEALLDEAGHPMRSVVDSVGLPAVHAEIDYARPLRLSDVVTVEVAIVSVGNHSVGVRGRFLDPTGQEAATANTVHVVARPGLELVDPPDWLRALVWDEPF